MAGPRYPAEINWPFNVQRIEHLPPDMHRKFYNQQRFTLNVTRSDMKKAGYSPSARLFEAAACGTPIISDLWEGLSDISSLEERCWFRARRRRRWTTCFTCLKKNG